MLLHDVVFGKRGLQEVWVRRMRVQTGLRLLEVLVERRILFNVSTE